MSVRKAWEIQARRKRLTQSLREPVRAAVRERVETVRV